MFLRKHCKRCPSCFQTLNYSVDSTWRDSKWAPTEMQHVIGYNFKENNHLIIHDDKKVINKAANIYNKFRTSPMQAISSAMKLRGSRVSMRVEPQRLNNSLRYYDCYGVFCYSCGYVSFESKDMLMSSMLYKCDKLYR